jgi:hypothetical protein
MADDSDDDWISAADAVEVLKPVMGTYEAQRTICARANDGLIRTRVSAFYIDQTRADLLPTFKVPTEFWWDRGGSFLKQIGKPEILRPGFNPKTDASSTKPMASNSCVRKSWKSSPPRHGYERSRTQRSKPPRWDKNLHWARPFGRVARLKGFYR